MTTEQRLERLERENRWMRRIGAAGVAVAAAVFLIGQGKDKELPDLVVGSLAVKKLTVKDKDGKERAALFTAADGSPYLTFSEKNGTSRVMLSAHGPAGLTLYGKDGKTGARLATRPGGASYLTLYDAKGNVIWQTPPYGTGR